MPGPGNKHSAAARLGVLVLALLLAPAAAGQQRPAQKPAEDTLSLYVTVGTNGKLVQGLTADNFRVQVDGRSREFRLEQPETPATIALLVEYSQASYIYFDDIRRAVQGFLREAPEGHWYAMATYSHGVEVRQDFTKLKGQITEAFAALGQPMWNEIDTLDAVYFMLDRMQRMRGRKILILVGSGLDTFSRRNYGEVREKLRTSNVVIYAAGTGSLLRGQYEPYLSTSGRMNLLQAENTLRTLADESGGEAWFPRFEGAFGGVMEGIMQTIANQYKLVIPAGDLRDGKEHKIEVQAFRVVDDEREDFEVRVRERWQQR